MSYHLPDPEPHAVIRVVYYRDPVAGHLTYTLERTRATWTLSGDIDYAELVDSTTRDLVSMGFVQVSKSGLDEVGVAIQRWEARRR